MKTVYDPQGNKLEMEGVDARECVEHLGYTWESRAEKAAAAVVAEVAKEAKTVVIERVRDSVVPQIKRGRPARKG